MGGRHSLLGSFCQYGVSRFRDVARCISSNRAKASTGHRSFRQLLTSIVDNGVGYIVMGSLSHFTQGCDSTKDLVSGLFIRVNIHFVDLTRGISDCGGPSDISGVVIPVAGIVGSGCYCRASGGVQRMFSCGQHGNRCVKTFTPCNCMGRPGSGRELVISPSTTRGIGLVFAVLVRKSSGHTVTLCLGRRNMPDPSTCGMRGNLPISAEKCSSPV